MNVDVKIALKALSFRLKKVISNLINYDQTAYIKGRFIGESIRLIDDILYHTEQENIDGVLFAADIEKAFDSVEHSFIFAVLKKFGFGDDFIQWIKTFLFDASSCVMNNNFSMGYFKIDRGTRQGNPLSAYTFILCLEIFFIQVRSDTSIRGFKYNGVEIKLTAFADDTMFLVRDTQSLRRMLNLAKYFQEYSSLKFNVEKCEACWIGRAKGQSSKPIQCKWINLNQNSIKILGAHFCYNKQLDEKMNFYQVTTDCRTLLNIWKQRWLSLAGKIQAFKSLIASKPVYIATMKNIPPQFLDDLQLLHKEFIWDGKRPKVKHSTLIGNYEEGGFKDVDLPSKFKSLKIIWIRKFLDENNFHPWIAVAQEILQDLGGQKIFCTNLSMEETMKRSIQKLPLFYKELIKLWQDLSKGEVEELEFVLSQNLWNNALITSKSKPLYSKTLSDKGVNSLSDLTGLDGNFISWELLSSQFDLTVSEFLPWYGVIQSIPAKWKIILKRNTPEQKSNIDKIRHFSCGIFINESFITASNLTSKIVYQQYIEKLFKVPIARLYFSRKLNVPDEYWPTIYTLASQLTIDSKMRIFQYRILNNILYLNKALYCLTKISIYGQSV